MDTLLVRDLSVYERRNEYARAPQGIQAQSHLVRKVNTQIEHIHSMACESSSIKDPPRIQKVPRRGLEPRSRE